MATVSALVAVGGCARDSINEWTDEGCLADWQANSDLVVPAEGAEIRISGGNNPYDERMQSCSLIGGELEDGDLRVAWRFTTNTTSAPKWEAVGGSSGTLVGPADEVGRKVSREDLNRP